MKTHFKIIIFSVLISNSIDAASLLSSTNTVAEVEDLQELKLNRAIQRMNYLNDAEVVKRGFKDLEDIIKLNSLDLSWRADLRQALLKVVLADAETQKNITSDIKMKAGELIGKTKILNAVSAEMQTLLEGTGSAFAEAAIKEFVKATHSVPNTALISVLKTKKSWMLIQEIVIETNDQPTLLALINEVNQSQRYDLIYGIDSLAAADLVGKHLSEQLLVPSAPTDLTVTLTTPTSTQLSWKDNSLGEDGFIVERSEPDQEFKSIATLPSNQVYYADKDLPQGKTYTYRVKTFNFTKTEGLSSTVSIEVPSPAPEPAPASEAPVETPPVAVTTEEPPAAPAPVPIPPPLPDSPPPAKSLDKLIPQVKIIVEGKPHAATIEALLQIIKKMQVNFALAAGNILASDFSREAFDSAPEITSLGLKAIKDLNAKGDAEFFNMQFPDLNVRQGHKDRLRKSASTLEKRFNDE